MKIEDEAIEEYNTEAETENGIEEEGLEGVNIFGEPTLLNTVQDTQILEVEPSKFTTSPVSSSRSPNQSEAIMLTPISISPNNLLNFDISTSFSPTQSLLLPDSLQAILLELPDLLKCLSLITTFTDLLKCLSLITTFISTSLLLPCAYILRENECQMWTPLLVADPGLWSQGGSHPFAIGNTTSGSPSDLL
ncbi:hypothetical protein LguiB_020399 [Lonicera macranthoides]